MELLSTPDDLKHGRVTVWNRHLTRTLDGLALIWTVTENGRGLAAGRVDLPCLQAGERAAIALPLPPPPAPLPGAEYRLDLSCESTRDGAWGTAGQALALEQFALPWPVRARQWPNLPAGVRVQGQADAEAIVLRVGGAALRWDRRDGRLASWIAGGVERLASGPVARYALAQAGLEPVRRELAQFDWEILDSGGATVKVATLHNNCASAPPIRCETTYCLAPNGELQIRQRSILAKGQPALLRIGLELTLPAGFERMHWYGRGFNHDRKCAAFIGDYTATISEFSPQGVRGGCDDVRWGAFRNPDGEGLLASGMPVRNFDALHITDGDLEADRHELDPGPGNAIRVKFDFSHPEAAADDGVYEGALVLRALRPDETAEEFYETETVHAVATGGGAGGHQGRSRVAGAGSQVGIL